MLRREGVSTSLAVLPVFAGGGRGCWVDLSANDLLTPEAVQLALPPTRSSATTPNRSPLPDPNSTPRQVLAQLSTPAAQPSLKAVRALHVGYPHLLTQLRGSGLADVLAVGSALVPRRTARTTAAQEDQAHAELEQADGVAQGAARATNGKPRAARGGGPHKGRYGKVPTHGGSRRAASS